MSLKAFEKWFDESGEDDHLYSYMLNSWQAALEHRESEGMRDHKKPAAQEPVAWIIDWPEDPELGHYFSEGPNTQGRSRPLYTAPPAAPDVSGLVAALEEIVAVDVVSDQTTTDYEMSQLKGLAVRKMKKIAGDALSAYRESQP